MREALLMTAAFRMKLRLVRAPLNPVMTFEATPIIEATLDLEAVEGEAEGGDTGQEMKVETEETVM